MTILPYTRSEGDEKPFLAEAEMALEQALIRFPGLTPSGLGGKPGDFDLASIACGIEFLRGLSRAPAKKGLNSYNLKHVCERACGSYIANGAILAAAAYVGLEMVPINKTPNAMIGINKNQLSWESPNEMYSRSRMAG